METQDSSLPLSGIVVLDLTRVLAGPHAARMLLEVDATRRAARQLATEISQMPVADDVVLALLEDRPWQVSPS